MGCGPVLGGLIVNAVGMEHSFWVLAGLFAVVAVLYSVMAGLSRELLCCKEHDSKTIEMGYHLVPNPSSTV
jgi:hypothetical protein